MGSRTVGGTVVTLLQHRASGGLSVALILIWALSPLGAQSALRMLESQLEPRIEPSAVTYFDTDAYSQPSCSFPNTAGGGADQNALISYLKTMFAAALLTPKATKLDPMDLWGNVKIPILKQDDESWRNTSCSPDLEYYSALVGIPTAGFSVGNTTFSLESSYLDLECSNLTKSTPFTESVSFEWPNWNSFLYENGSWWGFNTSVAQTREDPAPWAIALNRFVDPFWSGFGLHGESSGNFVCEPSRFKNETGIEVGPTRLYFEARLAAASSGPTAGFSAYCDTRQKYVESQVSCQQENIGARPNCTVTAQRPSRLRHAPESISYLSIPWVFRYISRELPLATAAEGSGHPGFILQYLNDTDIGNFGMIRQHTMFENTDPELFSRRLSQIINTYILLSQTFLQATGSSAEAAGTTDYNILASAELSTLTETFSVPRLWSGLCLLSSLILLICGILSTVLAHMATGPDILGYASALVRDSRYIETPHEVGCMEGAAVSKKMKDMRIRYGLVEYTPEGQPRSGVGLQEETQPVEYVAKRQPLEAAGHMATYRHRLINQLF